MSTNQPKNNIMKTIYATVQTKSNFAGLNGQQLKVIKFCGSLVACEYKHEDGTLRTCDFSLSEITRITEIN